MERALLYLHFGALVVIALYGIWKHRPPVPEPPTLGATRYVDDLFFLWELGIRADEDFVQEKHANTANHGVR